MYTIDFQNNNIDVTKLIREYGSPLYVYDADVIRDRYSRLVNSIKYSKLKVHYACKANTNLEVLKLLRSQGANIETVSPGEVMAALKAGYQANEIIFTCSNISREELVWLIEKDITVNLDSLTQLDRFGQLNPGGKASIRINQGIGAGHHEHVITGGPDSKFGIDIEQLDDANKIAEKHGLTIVGIHQHIGSNILDETIFMQAMNKLLDTAKSFNELEFIDFGGGFGVSYAPNDPKLDIQSLGSKITNALNAFTGMYGRELIMRFEAGRYLVAESGVLLVTVTDIKKTPHKTFVGVDSGFNHLVRPAMYDAYHHIVNLSNPNGDKKIVTIAGNVCESGDVFAKEREVVDPREGDILAILNTGAYGFTMSSQYNSRPRPAEVMVDRGKVRLVREREAVESVVQGDMS